MPGVGQGASEAAVGAIHDVTSKFMTTPSQDSKSRRGSVGPSGQGDEVTEAQRNDVDLPPNSFTRASPGADYKSAFGERA